MGALRCCFARTQTWQQTGKYVSALVSELPRRNGWTMAEQAGDRSPDRMQRLLNRASWDAMAAMSEVRRFAAAGLEAAARRGRRSALVIAAIDETGQQKTGAATAGVKRHYMGCAGQRWYAWAWAATASRAITCSSAGTSGPASWPSATATCPRASC